MSDERFILKNARHLAARYMEDILREGDAAVDATMGNGGDRLFSANWWVKQGMFMPLTCSRKRLTRAAARLEEAGMRSRATLHSRRTRDDARPCARFAARGDVQPRLAARRRACCDHKDGDDHAGGGGGA